MSTQDNLMIELENYKEIRPSDLNMRKTVKNVELLITAYKQEAIKAGVRAAPKVTASYSIVPPTYGNDFHSTTESAALDNIEKFEKMEYFVKKINQGLERIECVLDPERRERRKVIFVDKFIIGSNKTRIMEKLMIEHTTYHMELNMAVTDFACELGIEQRVTT